MKHSSFRDFIEVNPRVKLDKGREYPFVEMGVVEPFRRYTWASESRVFKNGGAKFITGDTLFARITPCLENGKIAQYKSYQKQAAFGSTEFFVFRARPNVSDPAFVYYLAKSEIVRKPAEKSMSGASGRQRAALESILDLEVPAPPLPTQRKIAAILSAYDDLIENNLRRIKILEEMAQNLYREWFVKFRFPGHEKARFIDSPLGQIPERWEVKRLDQIVLFQNQGTDAGKHLKDRIYLPIDCIPRKSLAISETNSWTDAQSSLHLFDEGDIIFGAMRPYFHKVVVAPFKGVTRKTCFVFKSILPEYHAFAALTLFQDTTVSFANTHTKGATIPYAVWPNSMDGMLVIVPHIRQAEQYEKIVGHMINRIGTTYFQNTTLRRTRDLLLPKLISGKVDVSELDITIPEEAV